MEKAIKIMWKNQPIDQPKKIKIDFHFTIKQFAKLTFGLIPQQMEDKWFIYYEDHWLYFHRSWTGFGMYKAQLIKTPDGYSIKEFWVERNIEKYSNTNTKGDIEIISFLIVRALLGINVSEIYAAKNIKTETDILKSWNQFGNLIATDEGLDNSNEIKSVLFGVAVGDALGVPVEFKNREQILQNPVTDMIGFGTYNQPAGTWSDDSSLTFCLAEALTEGFDLNTIGQNFVKWRRHNYWTARGEVFDVGVATQNAIVAISNGVKAELVRSVDAGSNGNGSLMRIAPLVFHLHDKSIDERYEIIKQVSSITHGHVRSVIACFYYLEFARQLLEKKDKFEIYKNLQNEVHRHLIYNLMPLREVEFFDRLLRQDIHEQKEENISSSGYVLHTLETSIWCLLTTDNYKDAVLKAVNLGEDTDTTAAVTGGLAGLLYGFENIPSHWLNQIAKHDEIDELAERLSMKFGSR